ncbi:MAG: NAD(P)H-dependent glycerol-3-phosphate dehydrogenase [Chitinophagales bacterium]|nr:NAD(P)H-dependent glycerol-3-phosphate dehydrogenase [Chitinophagales bacterium]
MALSESISMIGGGSWATALVKVLNENHHAVDWWIRNQKIIDHLRQQHHNPGYISAVQFRPEWIHPQGDIRAVAEKNDIIVLAVPSAFIQQAVKELSSDHFINKLIISAIKGMIPDENLLIAQFLEKYFGVDEKNIVNISGPSHAEEVALEKLTYLTMACSDLSNAQRACRLFDCAFVRCAPSDDVYGTEYAAVLKNIYAITAGIFHGLGYGDNFHAVLVSNCIEEMERFLKAVYPIKRDIKDSAYLGDLLVTAYSQFSRNRTLGAMIGKGYSVKNAQLEMNMVAEGYYASKCIHEVNRKFNVNMPIAEATYRTLHENAVAEEEMKVVTAAIS